MKKLIHHANLIFTTGYSTLRTWFDPAIEGNPYGKKINKKRSVFLFPNYKSLKKFIHY